MTYDPDLYGPPERGNEDPQQEDDWTRATEPDPFEWVDRARSFQQAMDDLLGPHGGRPDDE
jgi:hypothetical protein